MKAQGVRSAVRSGTVPTANTVGTKKSPLARGAYLLNLIYEKPLSRVSASTRWAKMSHWTNYENTYILCLLGIIWTSTPIPLEDVLSFELHEVRFPQY